MYERVRRDLRDAVLADVERSGRPVVTRADEVEALFGGVEDLLLSVHHQWWTVLEARLDAVLEAAPTDPERAVTALWTSLDGPARRLLDAHRQLPALRAAENVRRARFGAVTGIDPAALDEPTPEPVAGGSVVGRLGSWWAGSVRPAATAMR